MDTPLLMVKGHMPLRGEHVTLGQHQEMVNKGDYWTRAQYQEMLDQGYDCDFLLHLFHAVTSQEHFTLRSYLQAFKEFHRATHAHGESISLLGSLRPEAFWFLIRNNIHTFTQLREEFHHCKDSPGWKMYREEIEQILTSLSSSKAK